MSLLAESILRIVNQNMNVVELAQAADSIRKTEGLEATVKLYEVWVDRNEDAPLLYVVLFNFSTIMAEMGDFEKAAKLLERSIVLNSDFNQSRINLGRAYEHMGKPRRAVMTWSNIVDKLAAVNGDNIYHKCISINQMARLLEIGSQDTTVETFLRQSVEIDRNQREVIQHYLATRQRLCNWPLIEPWGRITRRDLLLGISPLSMAIYSDDPIFQLAINAAYNEKDVGDMDPQLWPSHDVALSKKDGPLRIGYLSSDLREHAIGFLMAEVFGLHNRDNVEVFVYYCGLDHEDSIKLRIQSSVDHWTSINGMSDTEAAKRIAEDGIHILVDVNGYTRDARTRVVACRPAPVIVNWLGFPGSTASPYHNYIIADEWIVPKGSEKYYTEKVMRLSCYQPNDRKRIVAVETPTRADVGLPENAMVYCCFNGVQKISRFTFDRWLTILNRVPGSVLWLLAGTDIANQHLRNYAASKGVDADRLVFAEKKNNPEHLARYPLADLFLDTAPYGAHTTASDALWMGVPVLTFSGQAFASRVCGSLVRSAGLPDLACTSADEYIDRAVILGTDKSELQRYRETLANNRATCDLFNTPKLVRKLEEIYKEMWREFQNGECPVPNLTNMSIYLDIGSRQDHDALEVQTLESYEVYWRKLLAKRHKVRPISNDQRFWTNKDRKKSEN